MPNTELTLADFDPLREMLLSEGFVLTDTPTLSDAAFALSLPRHTARVVLQIQRERVRLEVLEAGKGVSEAEMLGPPLPSPQRLRRLLKAHGLVP